MSKKVLVVDDDPDVRTFNIAVLEENGYQALVATNGEEGMELVKKHRPDLLILDVLMPRESGIRLYREIKTDKALKNTPVVIMSGIAEKSFLRSQKALTEFGGAAVPEPDGYLEKPVDADVLAAKIKEIIG